jgi:hypothetical protein
VIVVDDVVMLTGGTSGLFARSMCVEHHRHAVVGQLLPYVRTVYLQTADGVPTDAVVRLSSLCLIQWKHHCSMFVLNFHVGLTVGPLAARTVTHHHCLYL